MDDEKVILRGVPIGDTTIHEICVGDRFHVPVVSASGKLVATYCLNGTSAILQIRDSHFNVLKELKIDPRAVTFDGDDRHIAVKIGKKIEVYDLSASAMGTPLELSFGEKVDIDYLSHWDTTHLAYSSNSKELVAGGEGLSGGRVVVWSAESGKIICVMDLEAGVTAVAASDRWVAAGLRNGATALIDTTKASPVVQLIDAGSKNWLVVAEDGHFDGNADALRWVGWRTTGYHIDPIEKHFNELFRPELLFDLTHPDALQSASKSTGSSAVSGATTLLREGSAETQVVNGQRYMCLAQPTGVPSDGVDKISSGTESLEPDGSEKCVPDRIYLHQEDSADGSKAQSRPSDPSSRTIHVQTFAVEDYPAAAGFSKLKVHKSGCTIDRDSFWSTFFLPPIHILTGQPEELQHSTQGLGWPL